MSMGPLRSALLTILGTALAACHVAAPVAFPDKPELVRAQAGWCDLLVKSGLAEASSRATCAAAITTASPAFLKAMTKCVAQRLESYGQKRPDRGILVAECRDEAQYNIGASTTEGAEVIEARCQRMQRCERVAASECRASMAKLEGAQRAVFTSTYNPPALHEVAECLSSKSCTDHEDEAQLTCYAPVTEQLVWFPN
jgi:hypothetical protein